MSYIENLEKQLFEMQDLKYRDFHSKLLPGIDRETIFWKCICHLLSPCIVQFTHSITLRKRLHLYYLIEI